MAKKAQTRARRRLRRRAGVRKKVHGTLERPRLSVFRSHKHIYAQIIRDDEGTTLVAASSLDPQIRAQIENPANQEGARAVGELLAQRALAAGVEQVSFDRGGYLYHGRVKALAEGARAAGLDF